MSRQLLIRLRMLLYQQCSSLCTLCYLRAKHAFCRQRDVEEIYIRRTNAHVTRTEHSSCDNQSNRALLCLGVNSGRLTGILAFRPPLFSIILLLFELILCPYTGHWFRSLRHCRVYTCQSPEISSVALVCFTWLS